MNIIGFSAWLASPNLPNLGSQGNICSGFTKPPVVSFEFDLNIKTCGGSQHPLGCWFNHFVWVSLTVEPNRVYFVALVFGSAGPPIVCFVWWTIFVLVDECWWVQPHFWVETLTLNIQSITGHRYQYPNKNKTHFLEASAGLTQIGRTTRPWRLYVAPQ